MVIFAGSVFAIFAISLCNAKITIAKYSIEPGNNPAWRPPIV